MSDLLRRLARSVFTPLLGWLSSRFDELRQRLDSLVDGQAELVRLQHHALTERDAGLDAVSRAIGVQGVTLESVRAEQLRLADEVRALREQVAALEPAAERVAD